MFTLLVLLGSILVPETSAQSATIFPVALGPEANLQGEIIGSGGEVGTTFVLSGETRGIAFTLTLGEDASRVAEKVSIPSLSFELDIGCVVSGGSAICENVAVGAGVTSTLPLTTLPFSPFAMPVSTSGVITGSSSSPVGTAPIADMDALTSPASAPSHYCSSP
ncbi:hypothetical protein A7U60_g2291 [Sanghuangporus baumii]|uniref:Uncharacterized protein n=1 Tax=Sanghuangporus baumii TaxID=108892 RepID=A0A9Q5NAQ6_SANBA|nr:hypothetical protein A7U60_g2291 [Sanghuangporus baumii]